MTENILVCVAWPYANGPLHHGQLGGAYLPADIFARYHRAKGNHVAMVSGSDVHGTPITVRAEAEGRSPEEVVAEYHAGFLRTWEGIGIAWDVFTSTGTENHAQVAQDLFRRLLANGYLYTASQTLLYDPADQRFLPDRYVEGTCPHCAYERARGDQCDDCGRQLDATDLLEPRSKTSGATPELRESEHYFLKLSALAAPLEAWFASGKEHWRKHVLNFSQGMLREGLKDRAITRDILWGIPVPADVPAQMAGVEGKRIYVWFEAVIGYLSATIEWAQRSGDADAWRVFWEQPDAKIYNFIGKDNVPFHTIIWPAILLGAGGLNLPYDVPANQYITMSGSKASTSQNWAVWVEDYLTRYDPDALRYALAAQMPETSRQRLQLGVVPAPQQRRVGRDLGQPGASHADLHGAPLRRRGARARAARSGVDAPARPHPLDARPGGGVDRGGAPAAGPAAGLRAGAGGQPLPRRDGALAGDQDRPAGGGAVAVHGAERDRGAAHGALALPAVQLRAAQRLPGRDDAGRRAGLVAAGAGAGDAAGARRRRCSRSSTPRSSSRKRRGWGRERATRRGGGGSRRHSRRTAGDTAGETAGLIDSHAHLHDRAFGTDRAAVLARARAAGLSAIVTVGTDRPESEAAVALARAEPDVFAAVGFHPHDAKDWTAAERAHIAALAGEEAVVAIGEIGLDFYRNLSPRADQERAFRDQLSLADELALPVVIHSRDAHAETVAILDRVGVGPGASGRPAAGGHPLLLGRRGAGAALRRAGLRDLVRGAGHLPPEARFCGRRWSPRRAARSWSRPTAPTCRRRGVGAAATSRRSWSGRRRSSPGCATSRRRPSRRRRRRRRVGCLGCRRWGVSAP